MHIWTRTAVSIAVLVYLSVIGLSLYFPELDFKLILLLVGLVFLGMPHGAMDIFLAYKAVQKSQQLGYFIGSYLVLAGGIVVLWMISPTFSFLFFLMYSMFHFADSDLQKNPLQSKMNTLEFFARLPLPFSLPLIFHEAKTLELIQIIHPQINFEPFVLPFQIFGYLGLALTAIFVLSSAFLALKEFGKHDLTFLEPAVLVVLFSQITPMYALGIYFCFIHAIKHITNVITKIEVKSMSRILPYWLLPLAGIPILFFIYSQLQTYSAENFQQHLFQYILITLSVLAFPHAILIRYCKQARIIN